MATSAQHHDLPTLDLNDDETRLRTMLLDAAKHINPEKPPELRFAGGWVRDKLLGVGSHDIDIAINDMTGETFGLQMKDYLELPGILERYGMGKEIVKGLHKIAANPEKSKQLETACTKVFGLDLDLVNLRKETYADHSRNPIMEFGTPEEDAFRRDATINAMFYNLQTAKVEDFTGKGLVDMKRRVIQTPLAPYQTFKDDPLRILRLIRFASRLDYSIEPEAIAAMKEDSIKAALKAKISRERVGIEVEKMLKGNDPHMALKMIDRYGLYDTIFVDPTTDHHYAPETQSWSVTYGCLQHISTMTGPDYKDIQEILLPDAEHRFHAWVLAAHAPYVDAPLPKTPANKKALPPLAVMVAREGIKATNKVCDIIHAAVTNLEHIILIKDDVVKDRRNPQKSADAERAVARGRVGMAIRRWGPSWPSQVAFALMTEVTRSPASENDILGDYMIFLQALKDLELLDVCNVKPLIDGKQLIKELDTKPGPWLKDALDLVMVWQLRHPGQDDPAGAIEAVKNGELTALLASQFLELTIRPLFVKHELPNVTPQGHQRMPGSAKRRALVEEHDAPQPWKEPANLPALQLLRWCLVSLPSTQLENRWGLLIPPILRMVDDTETKFKVRGLEFLHVLLSRITPDHIQRTGMGPVLEAAIRPALYALPSLTPEPESVEILHAGFNAWMILVVRRWPPRLGTYHTTEHVVIPQSPIDHREHDADLHGDPPMVAVSYDFLLHLKVHMLQGYVATSLRHLDAKYPQLARLLLTQLQCLLRIAGPKMIEEKHVIMPLVTEYLQDPLVAKTSPELLVQAVRTMKTILACAWTMVWFWRAEILEALSEAWVNVCSELAEDSVPLTKRRVLLGARCDLMDCAETMLKALQHSESFTPDMSIDLLVDELQELVDAEPLCSTLFARLITTLAVGQAKSKEEDSAFDTSV